MPFLRGAARARFLTGCMAFNDAADRQLLALLPCLIHRPADILRQLVAFFWPANAYSVTTAIFFFFQTLLPPWCGGVGKAGVAARQPVTLTRRAVIT